MRNPTLAVLPRVWQLLSRTLRESPRSRSWFQRTFDSAVLVFAYHDLREPSGFASWLRVEGSRFREHLKTLSNYGTFLSPSAFAAGDQFQGAGPHFLITFDDGYVNSFRIGLPILREQSTEALFFVSSYHLLTSEPFWFDRVVAPIQLARLERIDLRRFGLDDYRFRARDEAARWEDIQRLLVAIKRLGNAGDVKVAPVIRYIEALLGGRRERWPEDLRSLRVEELAAAVDSPHCHVGSHGHRHEILTRLGDQSLADDLARSRQELERTLGYEVRDIAYPNGDCDARVVQACRKTGFLRGYVGRAGIYSTRDDSFQIPRVFVGGYDSGADLAERVSKVLFRHLFRSIRGLPRKIA